MKNYTRIGLHANNFCQKVCNWKKLIVTKKQILKGPLISKVSKNSSLSWNINYQNRRNYKQFQHDVVRLRFYFQLLLTIHEKILNMCTKAFSPLWLRPKHVLKTRRIIFSVIYAINDCFLMTMHADCLTHCFWICPQNCP